MDYYEGSDYRVVFVKSALNNIKALDKEPYIKVRDVINALAYNPRPPQASKVKRSKWHMQIPAGDYTIFYDIDSVAFFVIVTKLAHQEGAV
jgi:mRNA-degrading endonuclease RelE of RelBE toxin-antitoxin system